MSFIWPHSLDGCTAITHGLMPLDASMDDLSEDEKIRIRDEVLSCPFQKMVGNKASSKLRPRTRARKPVKKNVHKKSPCDEKREMNQVNHFITSEQMNQIKRRVEKEYKQICPWKKVTPYPSWMDPEMANKCLQLSTFPDGRLNQLISRLILSQGNFSSAINMTIKCFWSRATLDTHYIPPSMAKVDYIHIAPYYEVFHKLWRSLQPEKDIFLLNKFKKKFSSYISSANKNARESSRKKEQVTTFTSNTFNSKSKEYMEEMKYRCRQLLQSHSFNSLETSSKQSNYKWFKLIAKASEKSRFFPDQKLNDLLCELLSRKCSLWSAIRNVALVFWPREYLKTHYVPCPKTRLSSRSPAEGANLFHEFWFTLLPQEAFLADFKLNLRKINQSLSCNKADSPTN